MDGIENVLLGGERFVKTMAHVGFDRKDMYVSHVISVTAEHFGSFM